MLAFCPVPDVTVHVEPRKSCRIDENNPFALVQVAASEHGLAVHDVHILSADSTCHIELHVELPGTDAPLTGRTRGSRLLRTRCGRPCPGVEIVSHMEPKAPKRCAGTGRFGFCTFFRDGLA